MLYKYIVYIMSISKGMMYINSKKIEKEEKGRPSLKIEGLSCPKEAKGSIIKKR